MPGDAQLNASLLVADEPVSMVDASLRSTIPDSLRALRDRHGITILYITHDLATAYRVSDYLLVLHKGQVVEAGDPESVLREPAHPYTQLLVDSIPWPDPLRGWGHPEQDERMKSASAAFKGPLPVTRSTLPDFRLAA